MSILWCAAGAGVAIDNGIGSKYRREFTLSCTIRLGTYTCPTSDAEHSFHERLRCTSWTCSARSGGGSASPASLCHIAAGLAEEEDFHRTALAERLCTDFGFYDVRGLSLAPTSDAAHPEIWHGLMAGEHPRGAGPLVSCQLHYLLGSEHGWRGGVGIAASALQLSARDRWIGWDAVTRRAHLHRVVGLSRFLIRPDVSCRNLASHVLGQLLRRVPADFAPHYGYAP